MQSDAADTHPDAREGFSESTATIRVWHDPTEADTVCHVIRGGEDSDSKPAGVSPMDDT